jgi:uncharacterized membrane protein YdbT with pleckstrin-like domain
MTVSQRQDRFFHSRLPIDQDEKILSVYKHHWYAYVSLWIVSVFIIIIIIGFAAFFASAQGDAGNGTNKAIVLGLAAVGVAVTVLFTLVPVYLRSQEVVVLTEEAVLQVLQPSLFASKVSQLNLAHIADVSVRQDFMGTIFGFGKITVETPGEQDNYEFTMLPRPQASAREIIAAHENFQAAVESGRMPTTLGTPQPKPAEVDPQQFEQFLQYQKMVEQQKQDAAAQDKQPPTDEDANQK